ncbi:glutamate receptor ionotropic, delta-2-like [Phlebotomus argentipes]|uniref:glutamate receptor ionotropic, delta-2-like n=1 Tax=Phlebotomus argentipes TaxID=94469 RepID=UPI002892EE61|nr:glutamate receptor ionotropic, delta-2-like [Phlebotomus argentipes]XP_059620737.1 glutamate receptor ionotropic, delta-2-like [Phlebotomus argentipes]
MAGRVFAFFLLAGLLHILSVSGESTECRLCESLLTDSDHCTFLLDESTENPPWNCPLVFPCGKIIAINYTFLMNYRAIRLQRVIKCYKFIIATQNFSRYTDFFWGHEKFAPYSKIILLESGTEEPFNFTAAQIKYIYLNALHVLQVYQSPLQISLRNILTGIEVVGNRENIPNIYKVLKRHHLHPLIDNEFSQNEINISLFHCPPFVVDKHPTKAEITLDSKRFDGIEYRLLAHITRRWKRRFIVRNATDAGDPWLDVLMDALERRTNVALCGIWLIDEVQSMLEVSRPYGEQCLSFLVPRLKPVPRDRYIYLAMNERVWTLYLVLTLFICLLVYFLITFNTNNSLALQFNLLIESTMEVLSIATQHGVTRFPRRFSAKILLIAWFFFCLLITAIYSTGLTSILTTSLFRRPIQSVQDILDINMKWGDVTDHFMEEMQRSGNAEYIKLADLKIDARSEEADKLIKEHRYAHSVSVLWRKYIAGLHTFTNFSDYASSYRVMDDCIYKFNTVFAFEKNSPYAKLFTREIPKYIESGLLMHWFNLYAVRHGDRAMHSLFLQTKDTMRGPHTFTVDNLTIALYIWAVGLALATIAFIVELSYQKVSRMVKNEDSSFYYVRRRATAN